MALLLVGGVHGVGKTRLSELLASKLGAVHVSAGALVTADEATASGSKVVVDMRQNQERIVRNVQSLLKSERHLVLDCHFTVIGPDMSIGRIPIRYFRQLDPESVILLEAPVETIQSRLNARDGSLLEADFIAHHMSEERLAAVALAKVLNIPVCRIDASEPIEEIASRVRSMMRPCWDA